MNPRVSILLTTYNRPELLEKAIQSVLDQEYQDWECIILDDNSDNEEQKKLLTPGYKFNDPRLIFYKSDVKPEERTKTVRYATMINKGLDMAKGEFITYLCDDDYYMPNRLREMVNLLDSSQEINVVYGRQQVIDITSGSENTTLRQPDVVLENASCVVDHSSVMHRRKCLDVVGKWDDDPAWWGEADAHFWEKLGKAGFHFHPLRIVTDAHLVHDGSWTRAAKWKNLGTEKEGESGINTAPVFSIAENK